MLILQQEVRRFYEAADRYLDGGSGVHELNGIASSCALLANRSDVPSSFRHLFAEWLEMVNRRWDEWGLEKHPLTEDEFKGWLRAQLPFRPDGL